jgi:hypothetical protein
MPHPRQSMPKMFLNRQIEGLDSINAVGTAIKAIRINRKNIHL